MTAQTRTFVETETARQEMERELQRELEVRERRRRRMRYLDGLLGAAEECNRDGKRPSRHLREAVAWAVAEEGLIPRINLEVDNRGNQKMAQLVVDEVLRAQDSVLLDPRREHWEENGGAEPTRDKWGRTVGEEREPAIGEDEHE